MRRTGWRQSIELALAAGLLFLGMTRPALADLDRSDAAAMHSSITDTSFELPSGEQIVRVVTLRDHNTRVVVLGTMLLGLAGGVIGTFMLLRKRALMGDALSHATLPGIGLAFMVMTAAGGEGKYLPGLLLGAVISGTLGVGCILVISHLSRLKEDTALGIVLSVFFGLGVAVLGIIQKTGTGHAAGLESFIYGKTASMLTSDAMMIAAVAGAVAAACALLFKEFAVLCFDQDYAGTQGWPVILLDVVMMSLVVAVTVIGLQAVGLILIIALLIIPPAAARFWTNHLLSMLVVSAGIGAVSGLAGAGLSALIPHLPAGAIIVVVAGAVFVVSMLFGPARGLLARLIEHRRLTRKVAHQHLLRALYERVEGAAEVFTGTAGAFETRAAVPYASLLAERSWSSRQLSRALRRAAASGLVRHTAGGAYALTPGGLTEARRVVRNHRLWELYLITHADIAPSHVDRDADVLEHVIGTEMVQELDLLLAADHPELVVPASPHVLAVR